MQPPASLQDFVYNEEEVQIVRDASAVEAVKNAYGFTLIRTFMEGIVDAAKEHTLGANTANPTIAIDALREWQFKADFLNQIDRYITSLIDQRDVLAPRNDIEKLILQEQLNHGRDRSGPESAL